MSSGPSLTCAGRIDVEDYAHGNSSGRAAEAAAAAAAEGAAATASTPSTHVLPRFRAYEVVPLSSRKTPPRAPPLPLVMWWPLCLLLCVLLALHLLLSLPSWLQYSQQEQQQQQQQQGQTTKDPEGEDLHQHIDGDEDYEVVKGPFVYTYDLGSMYTDDQLELPVHWYSEHYNAERIVPEIMRTVGVATHDPEAASLFFVPLFSSWHFMYHMTPSMGIGERHIAVAKIWVEVLGRVRQEFPYFNRTNGRDHFGVLAFDCGRCDMLTWVPPNLYGDMFFLTHTGDERALSNFEGLAYAYGGKIEPSTPVTPCFMRGRDIVVPPYVSRDIVQPWASKRNVWFGFHFSTVKQIGFGPHHNHWVRSELYEQYEHAGMEGWEFIRNGTQGNSDWSKMVFAACPPGRAQWTSRTFKAILGGAIPVTFFGFHANPFDNVFNYDSFSINVDPDDIPQLGNIMQSLKDSPHIVRRLQEGVAQVQEHFQWSTDPNKDATRLLIDTLRKRAKKVQEERKAPGSLAWLKDKGKIEHQLQQEQEHKQLQLKPQEEEKAKFSGEAGEGRLRQHSDCNGRRILMLQLPSNFNSNLELQYNEHVANGGTAYGLQRMASFRRNHGFGSSPYRGHSMHAHKTDIAMNASLSDDFMALLEEVWYKGNSHTLEAIFRWRMEEYDCLVMSHEEADWVYIPYYASLDIGRYMFSDLEKRDQVGKELVAWLQNQPAWLRSRGVDHVLVLGTQSWSFRRVPGPKEGWGTSLLNMSGMEAMMVLSVQPAPFQNEVGVPYPTPFHPSSWAKLEAWQEAVKRRNRSEYLLLFYVDEDNMWGQPPRLRDFLQKWCKGVNQSECFFLDKSQITSRGEWKWQAEGMRWLDPLIMSLSATFCLHPWGSIRSQPVVLESLLSGCIPVVLQECDIAKQLTWHYPLHFGGGEMQPFYMYVPQEDVLADLEGGEASPDSTEMGLLGRKLQEVPEDTVRKLRQAGLDLIPRLTYGGRVRGGGGISPPDFTDAFDIVIKGLQKLRQK